LTLAIDSSAAGSNIAMNYSYDVEGRLAKASRAGAPSNGGSYGYDALNRLVSRTVTSGATTTTTIYVHDIHNHIIAELDTAGVTHREYIWLNDLPVAVVDQVNTSTPQVYMVHTDHLGRPVLMISTAGAWVWNAIYDPFGAVSYIWSSPAVMDIRFPGQWFQLETGLAYNWHRHYDPSLGRYIQPDPLGLTALMSDGPSAYGYVGGNPLAYEDPEGEFAWGLAFASLDIALQLYEHDGNWRCINLGELGLSLVGGGLAGAIEKGAFRYKDFGSHTWDATRRWMNTKRIQMLQPGQHRHHWLFERNQGIGKAVPDWVKNQPWNTNPISAEFNNWLGRNPSLSWLGAPGWAGSLTIGGLLGAAGGNCDCK
jgi:RHS repeat-associated protein